MLYKTIFIIIRDLFHLNMQKNHRRLTTNGCLYLNLAFKQTYIMQVLTYSISQQHQLYLILYDGQAYIGAIYPNINSLLISQKTFSNPETNFIDESLSNRTQNLKLNFYDIVKVYPQLVIPNQPIILKSLQVIQSSINGPLGNQIIALNQFMHKRSFYKPLINPLQVENDQQMRKIIKINENIIRQEDEPIIQSQIQIQFQNNITKQRPQKNSFNKIETINEQRQDCQMNNQQFLVQQKKIDQNRQINENYIQQKNIYINQKSESTVYSNLTKEKDNLSNQNIEQQIQTQKKVFEKNINQIRDEQTSKQTKKVIFYQVNSFFNNLSMIQQGQTQKQEYKNVKNSMKQVSQIFEIEEDSEVIIIQQLNQGNQIQVFQNGQNLRKSLTKSKSQEASMYIKDLYERMHRFQIHCRINFICKFVSQKGMPCTKLFLIDQRGDQIVCMIFDKAAQNQSNGQILLVKGKVYSFQNGQVVNEDDNLSINVTRNGIIQLKKFFLSFNPKKMLKVGQIYSNLIVLKENVQSAENSKYSKEICICGILIGFVQEPKLLKFQFKVIGLLCDPQSQKSITFTLFVDELSSFPQKGSVVSLHNMKIFQDEHIIRLQPSRRAYILNEKGNSHEFFSQLIKNSEKGKYKLVQYRNLSQISFVSRTIAQLKIILSRILQHDLAYSEIDCSIIKISQKRIFNACFVCKKQTKPEPGLYTYCHICRKVNKYVKRVVFDLEVSDSTGSLQLNLFTTKLQGFINMTEEQYIDHEKDDRQCFLQLCTYQSIILKVKSQRVIGGSNHTAISAEKPSTKRGLNQIVKKIVQDKTKYITCW